MRATRVRRAGRHCGLFVLVCLALVQPLRAAELTHGAPEEPPPEEHAKPEWVFEADPYYSDIGYNVPLTGKPIPTITSDHELEIYRRLIEGSFIPRYMALELSVYPLPVLGTYLKSHSPRVYNWGEINSTGINLFESATAGFQEPYAASVFFGNMAKLKRPGDERPGTNLGYTGYLFSAGNKHIKDNVLVADNWYEVEWKIKWKLDYPDEKMSWGFRIGAKMNSNHNVVDVMYLSVHRSNLDFRFPFLSWMMNSDLDVKLHFSQRSGQVVRQEYVVGKKYPMPSWGYTPTLDFGAVWTSPDEYAGVLRTGTSKWTLVFRPSLEF